MLAAAALLALLAAPAGAQETPDPWPRLPERVDAEISASFRNLTAISIRADLHLRKATLDDQTLSAGDIRAIWAGERASPQSREAFVAQLEDMLKARLEAILDGAFPGSAIAITRSSVVPASLNGTGDYDPPVDVRAEAAIAATLSDLGIASTRLNVTESTIQAILEMGAEIAWRIPIVAPPGWDLTLAASVPEQWAVLRAEGGAVAGASAAAFRVANGEDPTDRRLEALIAVRQADAPTHQGPDASVAVHVDMRDVQGIAFPGVLSGNLGSLRMEIGVDARLRVVAVPDDVTAKLPSGVTLAYLNSDAFRIALREGILTAQDVDRFEQEFRSQFAERIVAIFGGEARPTGGLDRNTLAASFINVPADGSPPISFGAKASVSKDLSRRAGSAAVFYTFAQTFDLAPFRDLPTTYTIVFPRGLAVTDVTAPGADPRVTSENGRDVVTLTPQETVRVTASIAITEAFLVEKFWYVLLAFVLVAVLILLGIVTLARRRRGGRRKPSEEPPPEPTST